MEEAEALCDQLEIFVNGELQCIGNAKELTARYGGLYVLTGVQSSAGGTRDLDSRGGVGMTVDSTS